MKFKLDENLPAELGPLLRQSGHEAHSVRDEQFEGATDKAIAQACYSERRVLITLDLDFADIRLYPPQDSPGIIVLRLSRQDKSSVLAIIPRVLALTNPRGGKPADLETPSEQIVLVYVSRKLSASSVDDDKLSSSSWSLDV